MLFSDLLQETYFALKANKARSFLTVLGIVIGIGSVISMISIGQGVTKDIENKIQSLGSNLLIVMPGSQKAVGSVIRGGMGSANTLSTEDAEYIEKNVNNLKGTAPEVSSREQVKNKTNNTNTSIYGVDAGYADIKNVEIEIGSFISDANVKRISKVAVLGPQARDDLFGEDINPVGEKIKIKSQEFTVIGLTKTKGGTGFGSSDDLIYIPITTAQHYVTGNDSVSAINIEVTKEELMEQAQQQITMFLLQRHNVKEADFSIMNQADIMETMSSVSGALTLFLGAIAGISLLVGGIGIMNMMLTSVTERTREIGLRKSLGAKKRDINNQFLAESIVLTLIGGVIGIIIGWIIAILVSKFGGITTEITISSIFLACSVSALVGIVFGYYPAKRASKLNPIDALRYE